MKHTPMTTTQNDNKQTAKKRYPSVHGDCWRMPGVILHDAYVLMHPVFYAYLGTPYSVLRRS